VRWNENRLTQIRRGQEEALANRKRLVERIKSRFSTISSEETSPRPESDAQDTWPFADLDVSEAMVAAKRLRVMPLEQKLAKSSVLNRPTLELLEVYLETLKTGKQRAVLQWPAGQREIAILHPLAMLAMLCAPKPRNERGFMWCAAVKDFRTVYFPWRGGATGANQQQLLLDRHELLDRNRYHLARQYVNEPEASDNLGRLHETFGHLNRLRLQDGRKPHLAHPTLGEIYPIFTAEGGDLARFAFREAEHELFGRVRSGAALDQVRDYRGALCQPGSAPFALFGVSDRADFGDAMRNPALSKSGHNGRAPDICLLDLGPPALSRLGYDWEKQTQRFVEALQSQFGSLPILAVTRDPYAYFRAERLLRPTTRGGRHRNSSEAPSGSIILRHSSDPLTADPPIGHVSPVRVRVFSVAGAASEALASLSEAARKSRDPILAGSLRRSIGGLRRAISLPCGLATAYSVLSEEKSQSEVEGFLEFRSSATLLAPIERGLASGMGGVERESLLAADRAVRRAFDVLEKDTPVGSLVQEIAEGLVRRSSRSVLVFATDFECRLFERRMASAGETGRLFERCLRNGHITLLNAGEVEPRLDAITASRDRNSWKRIVLVAPSLEELSTMLRRTWLPDELVIACDNAFADRIASAYQLLATHPDLGGEGGIGSRLTKVVAAAKAEAEARAIAPVELELELHSTVNVNEDVIDLTDDGEGDSREIVILRLQSGRTLRARPGSVIIRYRSHAEINPFERAVAREISHGDRIVIPDRDFVEEARRILPVLVLAQNWVEVFHASIGDALGQIPGDTLNAKARHVLAEIRVRGARTRSQGAVVDWLRVKEHAATPREQLRPHAPEKRNEFDAFMAVINVPTPITERIWTEGIQPLRIDRRRAGLRMAQAFVSVLVDQHGATSGLDATVREKIGRLCARALDYLDVVSGSERYETGEADVR
jgi:hypothetical protein